MHSGRHNGRRPPHPGQILREQFLVPYDLSETEFSKAIGRSLRTVSRVVNGRRPVGIQLALRFAQALETTPEYWLDLQRDYDLARATLTTRIRRVLSRVRTKPEDSAPHPGPTATPRPGPDCPSPAGAREPNGRQP